MKIIKTIEAWSLTISVLFIIVVWYFLMQYVFLTGETRNISLFWYSYFFALAVWAILGKKIIEHEEKIKLFLMMKYPGSRPFEYLFFIFLFTSTGCLTLLVAFIDDITRLLLNNLLYTFTLVFCYAGAVVFGWLHYMRRIEG